MSQVVPNISGQASDLVSFTILVDGNPVGGEYSVSQIVTGRELHRIPSASITVIDGDVSTSDFPASTSSTFIPGKEIEIKAGYHSNEETIFKGIITKHAIKADLSRRPSSLNLECKDKAVRMTAVRRSKIYSDIKDSDVFSQMISGYNLDNDIEASDNTRLHIVQNACTDWDFINIRAEANKKFVWAEDGKVFIKALTPGQNPVQSFTYGSDILELEAETNAENQFSGVTARAWSYTDQEVKEIQAQDPGITGAGNLTTSQLSDVMGGETLMIRHGGKLQESELQPWADHKLTRSRLAKTEGKITIRGNNAIKLGDFISLSGMGDRFNGNVLVTGIKHEIIMGIWLTHLRFGLGNKTFSERFRDDIETPSASGIIPGVGGLYTAVVTELENDPDGEDRIKIKIPMFTSQNEDLWARISTLDAGNNRGSFFRPEIGDEVAVGFLNDDPDHPVILGMMNSSALPAPASASDSNDEKGFVTRSGMKIWFNDENKSIEISTPGGNFIKLDEDEKEIHLKDQNGNQFILNQDGITIESAGDITIKATGDVKTEGMNVSVKASAAFKAEGSAGAEMSSGATTVVKGSLVQIN